jgi:YHS domain-containing protein
MNRILILLVFLLLGTTLIMCSSEQKQEATTGEATETEVTQTDKAMCAGGCSMEMDKAQMVSHEVDGETHYYCSEKCKENHLSKTKDEEKKEL